MAEGAAVPANGASPVHAPWATWWLWLWGVVAVGLIALVFFIAFKWWAVAALAGFGTMEAIGLVRADDPYPPLTEVVRGYVPRWVAFTLIYGCWAGAGATWLKFAHPLRIALLVALLGWFTAHFDVTFDHPAMNQERAKYQRIVRVLRRRPSSR